MRKVVILLVLLFPLLLIGCNKATQPAPQVKPEAQAQSAKLKKNWSLKPQATASPTKPVAAEPAAKKAAKIEESTDTAIEPKVAPVDPPIEEKTAPKIETAASIQAPESVAQAVAASTPEPVVALPEPTAPIADPTAAPTTSIPPTETATATPVQTQPTALPTPNEEAQLKVSGSMKIQFNSRIYTEDEQRENPDRAFDTYTVALSVPNKLRIAGDIKRLPRLISKYLGKEERPLTFSYGLTFYAPVDGKERKIGSMAGNLVKELNGEYKAAPQSALRIHADKSLIAGGSGAFGGLIQGQAETDDSSVAGSFREYFRNLRGKKVSYKAKHTDPLEFKSTVLAAGPLANFPGVNVSGNLDYDYDTGNWLTNGINFRYDGEPTTDKITGSIKWIEDQQRQTNGLGRYEFNLRFNEERFSNSGSEEEFFAKASDEEQFFMVDSRVPTIAGKISYKDTFKAGQSEDEPVVVASSVNYDLSADKLELRQLTSFLKLWLLIVGPVNDE